MSDLVYLTLRADDLNPPLLYYIIFSIYFYHEMKLYPTWKALHISK